VSDQCDSARDAERVGALLAGAREEYKALFRRGREALAGAQARGDGVARRLLLEGTRGEGDELAGARDAGAALRERDAVREAEGQTQALRRIRMQLAGEIERQGAAGASLGESNQTLGRAGAEFRKQHPLLRRSHALLRALRRAEVLDMLVLWAAVGIFAAAVAFVLHRRLAFFTPESLRGLLPASVAVSVVRLVAQLTELAARAGLLPVAQRAAGLAAAAWGAAAGGGAPPAGGAGHAAAP